MDYRSQVMGVLLYIQQHLDEDLSVEKLAGQAGFSPFHFHRIFKGLTGESLMAHTRRLRMERAAWRLVTSRASILEVALENGYQTAEAFSRRFSKAFGRPPKSFREEHGFCWQLEPERQVHYHPEHPPTLEGVLEGANLDVETTQLEPLRVACLEHRGPYLESLSLWKTIHEWTTWHEQRIGICYDDPVVTPAAELRYEACVPYRPGVELLPGMTVKELWSGRAAVYFHRGSYEGLEEIYERFVGGWLVNSGLVAADRPCLEFYRVSPFDQRPVDECETLIYLPLRSCADFIPDHVST